MGTLNSAGGMWIRTGKKGNKFLSGVLEPEGKEGPKIKFLAFKNDKKNDRQPDYRIVIADDTEDERASKPSQKRDEQFDDDNLPF